jgi:two-component system, chemotaxis family, protein-glutamate methylesterase/glutaminase
MTLANGSTSGKRIKVLIVDDSALARRVIKEAVEQDAGLEVVGTAIDPFSARERILNLNPDVLTLDLDMPKMDGLTFLKILMEHRPMPVVVVSSLTRERSLQAYQATKLGAIGVLPKPDVDYSRELFAEHLVQMIRHSVGARITMPETQAVVSIPDSEQPDSEVEFHPRQLILMGSSTGGIQVLQTILTALPVRMPPICIVQHIQPRFSRILAEQLNQQAALEIKEAVDGDSLEEGQVLLAPGDQHLSLRWEGDSYQVSLDSSRGPVFHQRPSVDVLFESVAAATPASCAHVLGVLLTGMGRDGAQGLLALKHAGAQTMVQDEASSAVFGMPRAAIELGAADQILSLADIPTAIWEWALMMGRQKPGGEKSPG